MNKTVSISITAVIAASIGLVGGHFLDQYLNRSGKNSLTFPEQASGYMAASNAGDDHEGSGLDTENKGDDGNNQNNGSDEQTEVEQSQQPTLGDLLAKITYMNHGVYFISKVDNLTVYGVRLNNGHCANEIFKPPRKLNQGGIYGVYSYCDALNIISISMDTNYGTFSGPIEFGQSNQ